MTSPTNGRSPLEDDDDDDDEGADDEEEDVFRSFSDSSFCHFLQSLKAFVLALDESFPVPASSFPAVPSLSPSLILPLLLLLPLPPPFLPGDITLLSLHGVPFSSAVGFVFSIVAQLSSSGINPPVPPGGAAKSAPPGALMLPTAPGPTPGGGGAVLSGFLLESVPSTMALGSSASPAENTAATALISGDRKTATLL